MSLDAWLLVVTGVASALFGGGMLVFSSFVMPALRDLPPREGAAAMQAINVRAPRGLLLPLMAVTTLGSVMVLVRAFGSDLSHSALAVVGALLALAGLAITVAANVPLNNRLAGVDPASPETEGEWTAYLTVWARWNHLRALSSTAGAVVLVAAAVLG